MRLRRKPGLLRAQLSGGVVDVRPFQTILPSPAAPAVVEQPWVTPEGAMLRTARQRAKLTQFQAGRTVCAAERTWQDWERGVAKMHPGLWALFLHRTGLTMAELAAPKGAC